MNQSFETPLDSNDADATYKALRDSVLHVYQFATKIAKETNPDNELRVGWDLGDKSLINWISDTHCYLVRKGQKIQFLARPSKLEIISFHLNEGDRLLICSDNLRNTLTEASVDVICQNSTNADETVKALQTAFTSAKTGLDTGNIGNIIVMEVINNRKEIVNSTTTVDANAKIKSESSSAESSADFKKLGLWIGVPLLSLLIGAGGYMLYDKTDHFQGLFSGTERPSLDDTVAFIGKNNDANNALIIDSSYNAKHVQDSLDALKKVSEEKNNKSSSGVAVPLASEFSKEDKQKNEGVRSSSSRSSSKSTNESTTNAVVTTSESDNGGESIHGKPKKLNNVEAEKQNYDALLLQRDKWTAVVDDLKVEQANGDNTVSEKLIKAQAVLNRVNQKINVSSKKLGY